MEICVIEKFEKLIATKLQVDLLWNRLKTLAQDTIQRLNCVVFYLNMNIREKYVDMVDLQLCI